MLLLAIANFQNKKDHVYFHWYSTDSVSLLPLHNHKIRTSPIAWIWKVDDGSWKLWQVLTMFLEHNCFLRMDDILHCVSRDAKLANMIVQCRSSAAWQNMLFAPFTPGKSIDSA